MRQNKTFTVFDCFAQVFFATVVNSWLASNCYQCVQDSKVKKKNCNEQSTLDSWEKEIILLKSSNSRLWNKTTEPFFFTA